MSSNKIFHLFKQGTDAIATNQGFYFQYIVTLEQWLHNYTHGIDEDIYCEYEDDIFQENKKDKTRKFTQVKCYSGNFNLQDKAVLESLIHFYDLYLNHKEEASVEFVFEANCDVNKSGTSEGAKLLVEWVENQTKLEGSLLRRLSNFLKGKINAFIDKRFDAFEEANKEDKASIENAEAKVEEIQNQIGSSDFKTFIKSVKWNFDSLEKDLAIDKRKQNCYDLIPKVSEFEKDKEPEVLFALLLNEVVTCSTKEVPEDRCLTNQLFKAKIEVANTSEEALKSLDKITRQIMDSLEGMAQNVNFLANRAREQKNNEVLAAQKEAEEIEAYYTRLKEGYNKVVFQDESMTLASIYVQPRISVHERFLIKIERKVNRGQVFLKLKGYQDAYALIKDFAGRTIKNKNQLKNASANVMIMLGYPGQGKTSMCTHYLYHSVMPALLKKNKVFLVKLRAITNVKNLLASPINQLLSEVQEECSYIKKDDFKNTLIILDGLDELTMKEGMKGAQVEELCDVIETKASKLNCKILITSRYGYIDIERLAEDKYIVAQIDLMTKEEQYQWCENYSKIHPNPSITKTFINRLYTDGSLEYLKDLLSQPMLLQLVAMADISLDKEQIKNKAEIYDRLFTNLIERKWSKDGQINLLLGIDDKDLRTYLQVIALEIHKSENEYIRKNDLEELEETKSFLKKLHKGQSLNDCLKRLMISFYMNEVKKEKKDINEKDDYRNYAIEFLHKSLHEYLAAERIWELFKLLAINYEEDLFKIADLSDLFKHIGAQLSPKALSDEIRMDLSYIIRNDKSKSKSVIWERLNYFLPDLSAVNFIGNYEHKKYRNSIEKGINFCIPYLEILGILTNELCKTCNYRIPELSTYLRIVNWQEFVLNLSFLNFSRCNFFGISLGNANLKHADLSNVNLRNANLSGTNLSGANLSQAILDGASLRHVILRYANLSGARLGQTNLSQAYLNGVNLSQAILIQANLIQANLNRANLSQVDLRQGTLRRASLRYVDLRHANLRHANLRHANLRHANLSNANLSNADLSNADLKGADLKGADLWHANLRNARVSVLNFIQKLKDWKCRGGEEIEKKYYVDPKPQHYDWDDDEEEPYYLIKEKEK